MRGNRGFPEIQEGRVAAHQEEVVEVVAGVPSAVVVVKEIPVVPVALVGGQALAVELLVWVELVLGNLVVMEASGDDRALVAEDLVVVARKEDHLVLGVLVSDS